MDKSLAGQVASTAGRAALLIAILCRAAASQEAPLPPSTLQPPAEVWQEPYAAPLAPSPEADCSSCGPAAPCNHCCIFPRWTLATDLVFLNRSDSSDFNYDLLSGMRIALEHQGAEGWGFEAALLTLGNCEEPPLDLFGQAEPYESALAGLEFNLRRRATPRLTPFVGIRQLTLADWVAGSSSWHHYDYEVSNAMLGVQCGTDINLLDPARPFQLGGAIKAGFFGNDAEIETEVWGDTNSRSFDSETSATTMAECSLDASWRFHRLTIRGGYHLLWIGDVATAPEGLTRNPDLEVDSDVLFHGPFAGLDVCW
jgi:hypothetical protein